MMEEPIVCSMETRFSYCAICDQPGRVGAVKLKGWPHAPLICASCLRGMATTIELDGTSPAIARVNENGDA
jgi:hypothetical protein